MAPVEARQGAGQILFQVEVEGAGQMPRRVGLPSKSGIAQVEATVENAPLGCGQSGQLMSAHEMGERLWHG